MTPSGSACAANLQRVKVGSIRDEGYLFFIPSARSQPLITWLIETEETSLVCHKSLFSRFLSLFCTESSAYSTACTLPDRDRRPKKRASLQLAAVSHNNRLAGFPLHTNKWSEC